MEGRHSGNQLGHMGGKGTAEFFKRKTEIGKKCGRRLRGMRLQCSRNQSISKHGAGGT
ncbi:hypothetical protein Scep_021649 [Stephania cephalantha]|uniref:Uncharacterized protein n=1 Tax=Stephania cephalantha TaxID=152367 RepID=A0AAP0I1M5_9MAGN